MSLDLSSENMIKRAALVVDGFNLYHSIKDLDKPFLKWLNLWRLGEIIIPSETEKLVSVDFCTAIYPGDFQKRIRHDVYNRALEISGVNVINGHFTNEEKQCPNCNWVWQKPTEKQSDINVALSIFDGARCDLFDHGYLLSADSDQAATVSWFNKAFPEKELTLVIPPMRNGSKKIRDTGQQKKIQLRPSHIERSLFRESVSDATTTVNRPREYDPIGGYVHWDDRP